MPGSHLETSCKFGFFGKLPINGDFIQRDLPIHFVHRWDQWLQENLATCQQQLEKSWLKYYLTSPIWRFFIAPSVIDDQAYIGILGPSVDSVGRYFPMTIATPIAREQAPALFSAAFQTVYSDLESLFLSYLNADQGVSHANVETLIHELGEHSTKLQQLLNKQTIDRLPESLDSHRFVLSDQSDIAGAVSSLWLMQTMEQRTGTSLWWSNGSHAFEPSLLINRGLPDKQQFVAMLSGFDNNTHWRQKQLGIALLENDPVPDALTIATEPELTPPPPAPPPVFETAPETEDHSVQADSSSLLLVDDDTALATPDPISDIDNASKQLLDKFLEDSPAEVSADQPAEGVAVADDNLSIVTLEQSNAGFSEIGNVRTENQDAILIHKSQSMWIVADGMGGHSEGDKASQAIVNQLDQLELQGDLFSNMDQIKQVLNQVNHDILDFAKTNQTTCGSTVVILLQNQNQCAFLWAGDSRLYLSRNGQLTQLTKDHSVENGLIKRSNAITRAVGVYEHLDIECGYHQLIRGDRFLLCSDGVYDTLSETELADTLRIATPQEASIYLKKRVLDGEARDNLSGILVWF